MLTEAESAIIGLYSTTGAIMCDAGGLGAIWRWMGAVALAAVFCLPASEAAAKVPETLAVQGALMAPGGGAVVDGSYTLKFALYGEQAGGVAVWTEGPLNVSVVGGRFSLALGTLQPLPAKTVAGLAVAWLGITIAGAPELPRAALHSVAFALQAVTSAGLSCSGCVTAEQLAPGAITADKMAFTWAGAKTKGGPATAALDLQCTGCVSLAELKLDGDLDLGGNGLKAKSVSAATISGQTISANSFVGDGSKLSGIKSPAGTCPGKDEVMRGIKADGSLICVAVQAGLPPDGIDEVSNGLIYNQFVDVYASKGTPVAINDNDPTGVGDELLVPDVGLAQGLEVTLDVSNSDLSKLKIELFDPNNVGYTLWDGNGPGKSLKTVFPAPSKLVKGDLGTWNGKNPMGKWRIRAIDTAFLNNAKDGAINSWSLRVQTLSSKKIQIKGDVYVDGTVHAAGLDAKGSFEATGGLVVQKGAVEPVKCDVSQEGRLWFNTKTKRFFGCNGAKWARVDNAVQGDFMGLSYSFSVDSNTGGNPKFVADKTNRDTSSGWTSYCVQTSGSGAHWLKVDFGEPKMISQFAVQGYPGGSHKPTSTWYLQGSNDNSKWTNVWSGEASLWITGAGTYPPKKIIDVTQPGDYRWYRIYAATWTNGHMLMCNWAVYE